MNVDDNESLPEGVFVDHHGSSSRGKLKPLNSNPKRKKNRQKKSKAKDFCFKLQFRCHCPPVKEVRLLHPLIEKVFIPRRPKSVTYCVLHFSNEVAYNEVRNALHGKHLDRYKGALQCRDTTKDSLMVLSGLPEEDLKKTNFNRQELQQMRRISKTPPEELPESVKCNSSARELLIRYGMVCVSTKTGATKSDHVMKKKHLQVLKQLFNSRSK